MKREMKHSGVAWIGEIPEHWSVKKLKFSCKIFGRIGFRGYTADDLVDESEGAITLSPINMNNFNLDFSKCSYLSWNKYYESPEIMVEIGDVLLVKTASVGKCSYVDYLPKETTVNPQILVLKEHNDYSKFIAYLFHTSIGKAYIDTTKGGSTIYTISQEKIENYEFAFPPIEEQQKIAEFLDRKCGEIDVMISLQEKVIEELKAYKQSVITEAVTKGLNPNVAMKDSGIEWIGEIPEHWEICQLKRYSKVNNGKEVVKEVDDIFAIPVYGSGGIFKYTDTELYQGEVVMFGRKGTLGKPIYANTKLWVVDTMYFLTFNKTYLFPRYAYYQLATFDWQPHITQTALPSIVASDIVACSFPFPSLTEQQQIADYLDRKCAEIDELVAVKQQKIETLKEYKKSLIYEYVTGKKEI